MKEPGRKNSGMNVCTPARELKVGHKFSFKSSRRQTEVGNMIGYKIIIVHKIKTYQLFQRNTHFPNLKPAHSSPTVAHRGNPEELWGHHPYIT